ncbi:MAG: blaR [Planctomycetaceae bacterium]|nr:blaR [Planctomycetaceae bacterium]
MSNLTFSFVWCTAQVTIVSIVALVVIKATMQRRPEVAASAAAWSAFVALVATLLFPVQFPSWMVIAASTAAPPSVHQSGSEARGHVVTNHAPDQSQAMASFSIPFHLVSELRNSIEVRLASPTMGRRWTWYIAVGLLMGISVGLVKLLVGLHLLRSLQRRAAVIRNIELEVLAKSMLQKLGCYSSVNFAQSPEIDCAAVVGIIRPTILLSSQWTSWTPEELRAVLAHELAHLCRRDIGWRLIAMLCTALHFYHPLLRRLTERLVLAQELAADRLAIQMTDGVKPYLRSLAQLAIRNDAGPLVRPQPLLTPVFTGHLMRRIEMLRAMDCEQTRTPRHWTLSLMIVSIVMFGLTTTLMRCFAQTALPEPAPEKTSVTVAPATEATSNQESQPAWFAREKVSASLPAFGKSGGMHLNIGALQQTPLGRLLEATINEMGAPVTKGWDFKAIESVSSDANISVMKNKSKAPKDGQNQVTVGFTRFQLRTNRDIDWRTAIQTQHPKSVPGMMNGNEYLDVTFAELGPFPVRLHPMTPRELGGWISVLTSAKDPVEPGHWHLKPENRPQPQWSDEWNAIGGGMLTLVVIPSKTFAKSFFDDGVGAAQLKTITQGADVLALGIDITQNAKAAAVKLRFRCKNEVDPKQVLAAIQEVLVLIQDEVKKEPKQVESEMLINLLVQALQCTKTRIIEGRPNVIECYSQLTIPHDILTALGVGSPSPAGAAAPPAERVGAKPGPARN